MNTITIALNILALLNLIPFSLMAYDRHNVKYWEWIIPEKVLFISAACSGSLGGVLGMTEYRHKTKHWYFSLLGIRCL